MKSTFDKILVTKGSAVGRSLPPMQQQGAYAHYVLDVPGAAAEAKRLVSEIVPEGAERIQWIHTPPPWVDIRGDAVGTWAAKWFAPLPPVLRPHPQS